MVWKIKNVLIAIAIIGITLCTFTGIAIVELNRKESLFSKTKQARGEYQIGGEKSELVTTDTSYRINSTSENMMSVTVNIKNENGIKKVIKPDNKEVTLIGSKKQIVIDYDVEDKKEYWCLNW